MAERANNPDEAESVESAAKPQVAELHNKCYRNEIEAVAANSKRETWVPIPDYEGHYEVSTRGRVRSLKRRQPKILTLQRDAGGYARVAFGNRWHLVHRVVARAFIGECPPGHEVAHQNHVRDDNRVENLRYATRQENLAERRFASLTHCRRANHELTDENVYVVPSTGARICKACRRDRMARRAHDQCPTCGQPMPVGADQ